jgi:hypothetical protein
VDDVVDGLTGGLAKLLAADVRLEVAVVGFVLVLDESVLVRAAVAAGMLLFGAVELPKTPRLTGAVVVFEAVGDEDEAVFVALGDEGEATTAGSGAGAGAGASTGASAGVDDVGASAGVGSDILGNENYAIMVNDEIEIRENIRRKLGPAND